MKKNYDTPIVKIMHLRPEEKLAACEWPIGFTTTGTNTCTKTFLQVNGLEGYCASQYNNAPVSGS